MSAGHPQNSIATDCTARPDSPLSTTALNAEVPISESNTTSTVTINDNHVGGVNAAKYDASRPQKVPSGLRDTRQSCSEAPAGESKSAGTTKVSAGRMESVNARDASVRRVNQMLAANLVLFSPWIHPNLQQASPAHERCGDVVSAATTAAIDVVPCSRYSASYRRDTRPRLRESPTGKNKEGSVTPGQIQSRDISKRADTATLAASAGYDGAGESVSGDHRPRKPRQSRYRSAAAGNCNPQSSNSICADTKPSPTRLLRGGHMRLRQKPAPQKNSIRPRSTKEQPPMLNMDSQTSIAPTSVIADTQPVSPPILNGSVKLTEHERRNRKKAAASLRNRPSTLETTPGSSFTNPICINADTKTGLPEVTAAQVAVTAGAQRLADTLGREQRVAHEIPSKIGKATLLLLEKDEIVTVWTPPQSLESMSLAELKQEFPLEQSPAFLGFSFTLFGPRRKYNEKVSDGEESDYRRMQSSMSEKITAEEGNGVRFSLLIEEWVEKESTKRRKRVSGPVRLPER